MLADDAQAFKTKFFLSMNGAGVILRLSVGDSSNLRESRQSEFTKRPMSLDPLASERC